MRRGRMLSYFDAGCPDLWLSAIDVVADACDTGRVSFVPPCMWRHMDAGFSRALIEKMQHMSKTSVLVLFEAADRLGMSWKGSSMPTQSLCRHPLYRHAGFQGGDFSLEFVGSSVYLPTYRQTSAWALSIGPLGHLMLYFLTG